MTNLGATDSHIAVVPAKDFADFIDLVAIHQRGEKLNRVGEWRDALVAVPPLLLLEVGVPLAAEPARELGKDERADLLLE